MKNCRIPKIEISVKIKKQKDSQLYKINSSNSCADFLRDMFNKETIQWQEEFVIICLNRNNEIIGYSKISSGGTAATVCDPKIIFTYALNCTASSIILAHNHPSGNLKASSADIAMTEKLINCGNFLDVKILDHIIITETSYISLADEGLVNF